MPKIREVLGNIFPFMRTRIFAAALLAVFCAVSISAAAFGTNTVRINDDGRQRSILTVDEDLGLVLEHAGVTVSKDDIVTFSGFEDGFAEIDIIRAFEVKVKQQSGVKTLTMAEGTVKDALLMAGIKADAYDNVNYGVFENVVPGMEISYEDVDYEFETKQESIGFETVTEYSAEIESGKEELIDGSEGIRETTLRHKTVDGAVVETAKISSEVIKQPVSAKKLIGTKVTQRRAGPAGKVTVPTGTVPAAVTNSSAVNTISPLMPDTPIELDENGRPVNYSMLITGKATAYSASPGARTASGRVAQVGYVAVNPNQIPYGTRLYIRTPDGSMIYGYAVAADTGGFASQGRITVDLFFSTNAECISFGVRNVEIYVLN